jgi:hypothetical protein
MCIDIYRTLQKLLTIVMRLTDVTCRHQDHRLNSRMGGPTARRTLLRTLRSGQRSRSSGLPPELAKNTRSRRFSGCLARLPVNIDRFHDELHLLWCGLWQIEAI